MANRDGGHGVVSLLSRQGTRLFPVQHKHDSRRSQVDSVCKFIMRIKRGQFRDKNEQDVFIATMPAKAAKALKHYMEVAKSRQFAEFDVRRGKLFYVDENRLKMPRLRLVVPLRLRAR